MRRMREFSPHVVGFYTTEDQLRFARKLLGEPGVEEAFTVFGGPFATLNPEFLEEEPRLDALATVLVTDAPGTPRVPAVLAVTAVQPNPFNGRCRIRITVPSDEPVTLTVHDVAGRKVRALVRRPLAPGEHTIAWDGRDHAGRQVASGAYLLNLMQGEYATTGRVTYVK